ncbi:LysR family transcriptional regulator [Pedobacter jeongneungensis]|uniref:LysR family transcriptional regulator n=1 Tax=Pedobacter jeongneungensis TaxID=947309 RepID=UPI00046A0759|nr:LysR family transcriptional regulator [Pedobacter jeongneungensis]
MLDFRLQVFYAVAKRLNFTRAAAELFISQPAVTKHVKELEAQYKTTLFERSGNKKIELTAAGKVLLAYVEQLISVYAELEYDINLLNKEHGGILRIGASTTVAQYILPKVLALFHKKFASVNIQLLTGNTEDIEQALLAKEVEIGIIEGFSRSSQMSYEPYLRDEIVLVAASNNNKIKKDTVKPEELLNYPFLLREPGSGTREVIGIALAKHGIKLADLKMEMQLGGTESIKAYLSHSDCLAFVSVYAILKELRDNELRIIDIRGMDIERPFHFIRQHGQPSSLAELFIRFAKNQKID